MTDMEKIPEMKSITETASAFHLPVHFIRRAVLDGKIYAVQAGSRKFYVNQASVREYLTGRSSEEEGGRDG